ncbi:DUF4422 domain-containing protein [Olsenella profusa]|uniref:DUF4422 domain-containing protein n=1 Tax=Olsenella profusa TaxID=138595 RepID=A0ABS2F2L1_9ACTN|nr:DUF4422 domain-containing protein [Olsenella profusa]MBM6774807.1 DUF4422 domain-containing protein [Olsenella profusa]
MSTDTPSRISIFVSTHKPVDLFESRILQPVQVGSALANHRFPWALHDDEGDNISDQNPLYCEITTQYWAWKNVDADYYGFCHYRRYFDFSPERHKENPWGEVMDDYVCPATQARYGLDDDTIRSVVEGCDVITTEIKDLRRFPGGVGTPRHHYELADRLHPEDLMRAVQILKELHPDFSEDADAFLDGHRSCFCNMFIMKRDIFFDYCSWLFPILKRFVEETDMEDYSVEALRTPGHLAERLFNIYYAHHMRVGAGWVTRELQCVHFNYPDRHEPLGPLPVDDRPVVPVVLAADDGYVPMLATTVHSMLANASRERRYDVIVLERGISAEHKGLMTAFLAERHPNATLRFQDVGNIVAGHELSTSNPHISAETYYRFLIQDLLPFYEKVLYLDSDLIVEGDVAELFDTDMKGNAVAAVRDVDFAGNLGYRDGRRKHYAREVLGMSDPFGYFQAGVLLLDTAVMRSIHTVDEWLGMAEDTRLIYNDQDALNAACQGRVTYLDASWNVMTDLAGRVDRVFSYAPARIFKDYQRSRSCVRIIHYAGVEKPWNTVNCDLAEHYWRYARETPFYEALVAHLAGAPVVARASSPRAIGEDNPLRRVFDPLLPIGSRRREVMRSIAVAISGRK